MSTTLTQPLPGSTLPTYTEMRGEKPFDWNAFLAQASHTNKEWNDALKLAQSWVTCACGNQCDALPRRPNGEPEDYRLWDYGGDFTDAIEERNTEDARYLLNCIEERSAELLLTQAALAGKECNTCGGLGCPNCHGGASGKEVAHA